MNKVIADRMKSFDITCYDENGSKIDDIINSATKIKFPHAQASNLNLDKCREIGLVLSRCKMLQELCLSGNRGSLREDMLAALFLAEGPYNFPLQSLDFGNNQFGMRELTTILPFLKSWEELDYLSLEGNCINNEGAQLLADSLDTVKIRRLSLNRNQISKEGLSSILTSQYARYLASLMISDNEDIGSAEIDETARFLSRATTNLKLLQVGNHRQCFRIEWFEKLCRSLQNNTTMSKISIVGSLHGPIEIFISNEQRKNMEKYMADLMKSFGITCCNENGSKIDDIVNNATKIEFPSALHLNLDKCREIGLVLSRCKMLQELCLSGNRGSLGEDMLVALFLAEGPYNFPLKRLDLGNNQFGMRELTTILPFLKSWEELNSLSVEGNCINNEGAQLLAEVLDTVKIRRLSLNRNQINKEGLSSILSSQNAKYLTSLMISNNGHIGSAEIDEIASFLRHGSSSLEVLEVGNYRQYFLIQWVETIYRSIRNNTTLSKLRVFAGSLHDPMGKEASRKAISCWLDHAAAALVCDSSSIDAFCRSNHTFSGVELTEATLSVRYAPSPVVRLAFKINSRGDISTVKKIRCKLHSIFFHGDFDMEPFYAMKLVWIPQVLEFFAGFEQHRGAAEETKGGSLTHAASLSDLYYFIRRWNFPELFTFALPTRAS